MFVQVRLFKGYSEPLLYKIPNSWIQKNFIGSIVQVPLKNKVFPGIVLKQFADKPNNVLFQIREVCSVEKFPLDKHYFNFIEKLSNYYQIDSIFILKRLKRFLSRKQIKNIDAKLNIDYADKISLTKEQQDISNFLFKSIKNPKYKPALLYGVTGSGKTEVYKDLICKTINKGKSVLFLLPEVSLALQFQNLFKKHIPSIKIIGFHSSASAKEKKLLWQLLINGDPILIIGVHLPVLLPVPNLGLIIVDEEHDIGYQEKKHPKINTKEAAIWRAKINKIPILLGSATPSLSSLHNIRKKDWEFFQLKKRFQGRFPNLQIVYLSDKKLRHNFWISQELEDAIKKNLSKNEQVIIFLNRRGFSFFVQCSECFFLFKCENCSVSLTLHSNNILNCHYCNYSQMLPNSCPNCGGSEYIKKGLGTQKAVSILERMFPDAKIGRADLDTTINKGKWQKVLKDFEEGRINILVGTKSITKGYHFPKVTLVGVLWADLNMHIPRFNASEIALQQLIQAAGRAGRQREESKVIIQAMAEYPLFNYLDEAGYLDFYHSEIKNRSAAGYPPCIRFAEIELKNKDEIKLDREALLLAEYLFKYVSDNNLNIKLLGPSRPLVSKIKNNFFYKIYLKGKSINTMIDIFKTIDKKKYSSQIFFTPNPLS